MTYDELVKTVENSTANQWEKTSPHVFYRWIEVEAGDFEPDTFEHLAVYKSDIDITIAMPGTDTEGFSEPWVEKFPNPHAKAAVAHIRYRGALVVEWRGVLVDEYRYFMPLPDITDKQTYQVEAKDIPMARIMFDIYGAKGASDTLEAALKRAGIVIVP